MRLDSWWSQFKGTPVACSTPHDHRQVRFRVINGVSGTNLNEIRIKLPRYSTDDNALENNVCKMSVFCGQLSLYEIILLNRQLLSEPLHCFKPLLSSNQIAISTIS